MKKASLSMFYLSIIFLLILSACGKSLTIELPTDTPEVAASVEEPAELVEAGLGDMLEAGTAMKWFDDGYVVFVPAGEVTLGDNEYENNQAHSIFVDDFWIYMFQVTNGQYSHCVATGACTPPTSEELYPDVEDLVNKDEPVIGVTWEQAETYCNWMNGSLPSKAEWGKAARGPEARTYPWGNEDPDCDLLNYGECEPPAISKVYEYPEGRSYYNAFDLAGNAYEWVFDLYEDEIISQLPGEPPAGPPEGTERTVRGSSFISEEELIPSAQLFYLEPEKYRTDLGFRCVLDMGEDGKPKGFAHPCITTAWVPGEPPPGVPGPSYDENELPDFDLEHCKTDIGATVSPYCSDPALQYGGLDLTIVAAPGFDELYVKSYNSAHGAYCNDGTNPTKCFGPELTPITFEICATCTPALQVEQVNFYCDCLYELNFDFPLKCVYTGGPPVQGQTCPAGFTHDQVNDICVEQVPDSDECPDGYKYNPDTDCCEATFAPPAEDPDTPTSSYLICPLGAGPVTLIGSGYTQGQDYGTCYYHVTSPQDVHCITRTFNLGECRDVKQCIRPGSYKNKADCESAHCNWIGNPTGGPGGPGECVKP